MDSDTPVACSLSAGAVQDRLGDWERVLGSVTDRADIDGGARMTFGPGADLGDVVSLAAAEQACCPFFRFAVTIDERGAALEVTAPVEGQEVLAAVFGAARP